MISPHLILRYFTTGNGEVQLGAVLPFSVTELVRKQPQEPQPTALPQLSLYPAESRGGFEVSHPQQEILRSW